ncbi:putative metal-dependent peptidase [Dyadobacter sp. BE34]|uniref:Metal-dependent peptidase n=1 Tax=Dyadobacter fermentans TaxID=94254 RepID=A0ABU1QWT1_9BACT|nr:MULTISPECIES: VWA domain-containing protein [Dyadobacter]MDR6805611.1 putative metal-dependent peptidase [Dyadobacter fermentans]MDR7042629.1 putative metal-dependent peptidase [Dyadobacter sp. BE242]MDR7196941.1 putative metal-dependent peptidase [Dyadobacter sp. BE34]MDR7215624.1 putative metal-dependent peptidase [Dyadobacter sp. BE31]MDR7263160.1 putative metal-dependent peptidase [Dyadobacter sp. BE32]
MDDNAVKRWRLVLGKETQDELEYTLTREEAGIDRTLEALYNSERKGGLGASSPNVSRWLGDIREYFPTSVVKVMQQDALKRLKLTSMLTEPEMLETIVPDIQLVANLMTLGKLIPEKTKATAREVIRKVVDQLMQKLAAPTQQAITGSLNRAARNTRPRHNEINWPETIRKNLKHYQPDYQTIIPEVRIGYGRKRKALKDVVLCIDQSGSMGTSVIYSGIFGSVMASMPAVATKMVVFDTSVADLTEELNDPVDLLFGVQLGGGTDIHKALSYCQQLVTRPLDTVLVLISDLYEGGNEVEMRKKVAQLVDSGVQIITLLALNNEGAPFYDHKNAEFFASLGIPVFACTPDQFPDLMAAALSKQDIASWAGSNDIKL